MATTLLPARVLLSVLLLLAVSAAVALLLLLLPRRLQLVQRWALQVGWRRVCRCHCVAANSRGCDADSANQRENLTCCLCLDLFHNCVAALPCLHKVGQLKCSLSLPLPLSLSPSLPLSLPLSLPRFLPTTRPSLFCSRPSLISSDVLFTSPRDCFTFAPDTLPWCLDYLQFCAGCLAPHAKISSTCPSCRQQMSSAKTDHAMNSIVRCSRSRSCSCSCC